MDESVYHDMARLQDTHWWFRARRRILDSQLQALNLPADCRILEIGCGPGGNLPMLQARGEVEAVEMDDYARQQASQSGVPVSKGWLPDNIPAEAGSYDLVCLFDVLEHVADDAAALQCIHTLLRPGGRVLLTVPAWPWLYGPHDRQHHHYRRYRRPPLRNLLTGAGFTPLKLSYFNSLLFPLVAAARLLEKSGLLSPKQALGQRQPPAPLNALLYTLFACERHGLRRFDLPLGVSLLALARRT